MSAPQTKRPNTGIGVALGQGVLALSCVIMGSTVPASAQDVRTNIGTLTCTVAGLPADAARGDDVRRDISCLFKPAGQGGDIAYVGSVLKVGAQSLPTGKVVLIWSVVGPKTADARYAGLAQRFVGQQSTSAGAAPATQPSLLVGERDRAYALNAMTNRGGAPMPTVTIVELKLKTVPA